ncbi:MAG: hypothetical protein IIU08_01415 [Clostridia bacterium]|nr:hypothetical protein [Clostridia bacterium]
MTNRIKPLHGVGQPPFAGIDFSRIDRWLAPAGIPFSRLHDVGGGFGGNLYVDIPNLFRDFDADLEDPASYDFAFTDLLISALVKAGVEPFFRLGVTIENYMRIKPYRIHPPKDPAKWARICEHVVRHYNEGWAEGFHYGIRYWEIWNEPENHVDPAKNEMWTGTAEQYYELYDVTAKRLKSCFPDIKVGGYASCGFYALRNPGDPRSAYFLTFFDGFLDYVKAHCSPLDFFSWHSYAGIEESAEFARYARRKLDEAGFTASETTCNEWNPSHELRGTFRHAALILGWMLKMQNEPVDSAMFYDARFGLSVYGGLFDPMKDETYPAYDAFLMFNELYRRGKQLPYASPAPGVYGVLAEGDGDRCLVLANTTDTPAPFVLPGEPISCRMTGGGRRFEEIPIPDAVPGESILAVTMKGEDA